MKSCQQCGQPYAKRPSEAYWQFEERRFCGLRCAGIASNPRKPNSEFRSRYRQVKTQDGRQMLEHRWVMEQAIGRPLLRTEQVHHINHDRLDNRLENLELVSSEEHGRRHTTHATEKPCVICGHLFTPHKTKRVRAQTCGPACKSALLSLRNAQRKSAQTETAVVA